MSNYFYDGLYQPYDIRDRDYNIGMMNKYMLCRTQNMFKWDGLPDTVPDRILELYLQTNGNVIFTEYEKDYYVFTGGLGGIPDEYYRPTIYTVANPYLKLSKEYTIDSDCVLVYNDSMMMGLLPILNKYNTFLADNDISLYLAGINSRITSLISATDDNTRKSALKYLDDLAAGKLGVILSNEFLEGIKTQPYATAASANILQELIEYSQYLKITMYNDIGINGNYNMKRENLNESETQMNNNILFPFVDNMLRNRKEACKKINDMYGLNISVDLDSSWKLNQEEVNDDMDETDDLNGGVSDDRTDIQTE